ncbi:MAG: DUF3794 domain-containing protein [Clostridia bacterium]|nr:DUF3794 domain-containing protein [Clostridia bacterium]
MAIQTQTQDVKISYLNRLVGTQIATECTVDASATGGANKLLSASCGCRIKECEALSGAIRVSGEVTSKIIYLDGADSIASADYISEFNESIVCAECVEGMALDIAAGVTDIQSEIIGSAIKVQTVVTLDIDGREDYQGEFISEISGAVSRERSCEVISFKGMASDSFTVTEEYDTGAAVSKVLLFDSDVCLTQVRAGDGVVNAEGEACIRLVYESEGNVYSKQFSVPFAEELITGGVAEDNVVCATPYIKTGGIVLTGTADANVIKIELVIGVDVKIYEKIYVDTIADVFSPSADLSVTSVNKSFVAPYTCKHISKRVCGTVTSDSESGIRRITASVLCHSAITNIYTDDGALFAEGTLTVGEIYEEEDGAVSSIQVEVPFVINCDIAGVSDKCNVSGRCVITDIVSRVKRDRDIEVCATVQIEAVICCPCELSGVSAIAVGQEKEINLSGISAYIVSEGETLWDVAKALNVPEKEILQQNASLQGGVHGGDRVVVFRAL